MRCIEILPLLHFESGAAERQGVLKAFFDLHIEPTIDAAIDELHREVEDDQQRQYRKTDEHSDHACFEFGTRHVLPVVTQQARQVADQQRDEQDTACDINRQDNVLQAIKIVRLLHRLRQKE